MAKLTYNSKSNCIEALLAAEVTRKEVSLQVVEGYGTSINTGSGATITTISSMLRYLARAAPSKHLYGTNALERAEVDHWLDFTVGRLGCASEFDAALDYLNQVLLTCNVLVGDAVTIADFAVWGSLRGNGQFQGLLKNKAAPQNVTRYYKYLASLEDFQTVDNKVPKVQPAAQQQPSMKESVSSGRIAKEAGKWVELPDAEMGKVVVRFPPEASGYLHVGHAKAALLNQYYQHQFQGKLIMRFDDTNPAKENIEFEQIILEDVATLGLKPDVFTFTSDWFEQLMQLCEDCLRAGTAYCDDTDGETMKKEREERVESKHRNNSPEKNLAMWEAMKRGTVEGLKACVRAKMSMLSDNGCMRDPAIYRCKPEPHPRTGNRYKVYPTYDFACPVVDALEGVTHALRTSEYADRCEQYNWFLRELKLRKVHMWEYSRLNLQSTVMSKRKLTWFVEQGLVDGWDDPRFPTVRGVMRRGMTVEGLKEFVIAQGSSKSINMMEWDKIWAFNKKVIDPVVPRYSALIKDSVVPVHVKGVKTESKQVQKHPKDAAVGMKQVWYSDRVYIEGDDAVHLHEGEKVTFINWGNILIKKINKQGDSIVSIDGESMIDDTDFKKTQKLTWLAVTNQAEFTPTVCVHYDHIISKPVLTKDDDFKDHVNRDSKHEFTLLGDPELRTLKKGERVQLQRRGYYICDSPYQPLSRYTGRETAVVLVHIPDGHTKDMPKFGSKHKETAAPSAKSKESAKEKAQSKKAKAAEKSPQHEQAPIAASGGNVAVLDSKLTDVANKVRQLKTDVAPKAEVEVAVKCLLALKAEYKAATGKDWKAGASPAQAAPAQPTKPTKSAPAQPTASTKSAHGMADSKEALDLKAKIDAQGSTVRELKASGAAKDKVDSEVKVLKDLKAQYTALTGEDLSGGGGRKDKKAKPQQQQKAKPQQQQKKQEVPKPAAQGDREVKKVTRLGLEVKKEDNLADWYSQVITKAELIEYYDVSGCYVFRPWSFSIWEAISKWFDHKIKEYGFENCYFPMFVSQAALEKEKEHIADFAPEVAWVTRSGQSELAEPIAIRPTSETVMYPSYSKWVQSHRDLPIKLNQWCSVVRWEFKHPQPFLRTREFLWQEGHSAYATYKEAEAEVHFIIDLYEEIYETLLAIPVIKGKKTQKERFAGGDYTTTVEAYVSASGRGIQAATSHHLGQNFSKMFDISFEDPETRERCYAYQNSWAITTRSIGVIVMVHGDNKGLVLPPRIASVQVVVVPCGITAALGEEDKKQLVDKCDALVHRLKCAGVKARGDFRDNYSPGWKFNHWELKGVPLRVELGPKDLSNSQFVVVRRDTGEKFTYSLDDGVSKVQEQLEAMHHAMFAKAKADYDTNTSTVYNFDDFCAALDKKHVILTPYCGGVACEDEIKKLSARDAVVEEGAPAMGAKALCIPFNQPHDMKPEHKCVCPGCDNKPQHYTLFGRSY